MNNPLSNTSQHPRQMSREDGQLTPEYVMTPQHTMTGNLEDNLAALRMQSAQPDMRTQSLFEHAPLQMSDRRAQLLERTPQVKDQFQQQIDEQREQAFQTRVNEVAQQILEKTDVSAVPENNHQQLYIDILREAEYQVQEQMYREQEVIQEHAEGVYQLAQQELFQQQMEQQHDQNHNGVGSGQGHIPFEYISNPTSGGAPFLQGPPLVTKEGVVYSSYVDLPQSIMNQVEMMSASKMRFNADGDEQPNVIRNENSDDDGNDYAGALNRTNSQAQLQTEQRNNRSQVSIDFGSGSHMNSTVVTQHKADRSQSRKGRNGSNRKQTLFQPTFRGKNFDNELEIYEFAAGHHTDDEVQIRKPSPPKMSQAQLEYMQNMDLLRRQREQDLEEEEEEEKRLFIQAQPRRNLERVVGRHVVESVSGNIGGRVQKVHTSEIMKSFRCKDDFIKILTIEGQYYLPPSTECTIEFLRDICSGKKRALFNNEVKIVRVPRMPELTAKGLIKLALKDPIIRRYLPDLSDKQVLNKEFLFNIINTVKPSFFPENIRDLMLLKQAKIAEKKQKFVMVTNHIYNLIQRTHIIPQNTRGKAVHLLNVAVKSKKRKRPADMNQFELPLQLNKAQPQSSFKAIIQEYERSIGVNSQAPAPQRMAAPNSVAQIIPRSSTIQNSSTQSQSQQQHQ